MKRAAAFVGAVALVCLMSWLLGFDFDSRGFPAFMTAHVAILFGALGALAASWSDKP